MNQRAFLKALIGGAAQLALIPRRGAHLQDTSDGAFLDVRTLGARGDGRANDLRALTAAGELSSRTGRWLVVPSGTYRIDGPLHWQDVPAIVGVPDRTVIRSTVQSGTAVSIETRVNDLGVPAATFVAGLTFDGSASRAETGLHLGAGPLSGRLTLSDCTVKGFAAPRAVGLRVGAVVQGAVERLLATRNSTNILIEGPNAALPTTTSFDGCNIREALGAGLVVRGGYSLRFRGCVFESNGAEGVLVAPASGRTVLLCSIEDGWFENNGRRDAESFQCDADGSAAASTCNPLLLRCLFTTQRDRALRLRNCTNFLIDSCRFPQVNGCVVVDGARSHGTFANFQQFAGSFEGVVAVGSDVRNLRHTP